MKIKYISILLIALQINCLTATAQSWLWGDMGGNTLKADVWVSNVATNKTGNVYQTGDFENSISFGAITLISPSIEYDFFLVKYDQNGNFLWARQSISNGSNYAAGYSVATDDSDNSYITGIAGDTTIFGTDTLFGYKAFLIKYDPNGNIIWVKQLSQYYDFDFPGGDVVTDKFRHEYTTGDGVLAIKFDENGKTLWNIPLSGYASGYNIATDASGNVYVGGAFSFSMTIGTFNLYSAKGDLFIAKIDSSGNVLWVQQSYNSNGSAIAYIAVGPSGSVYLTSPFAGTISLNGYTFTSPNETNGYNSNFFVMKYSPNATILWGKQSVSLNNSDWTSSSICTDDFDNAYISGSDRQGEGLYAPFVFANDTFRVTDSINYGVPSFLLELDSLGNVICGLTSSDGGDESNDVASDSTGKFIYLGGVFIDSLTFGSDSLVDKTGSTDTYVARWRPCFNCNSEAISIIRQGNVLTSTAPVGNQWLLNNAELQGATNQNYTAIAQGWYKVINTNTDNNCVNVSDSIYIGSTGANCVYIYPNPTFNTVIVNFCEQTTEVGDYNLKVIDELGRVAYSMPSLNYSNEIDLSNLPAAMYFISVTNGSNRTVVPIVKLTN